MDLREAMAKQIEAMSAPPPRRVAGKVRWSVCVLSSQVMLIGERGALKRGVALTLTMFRQPGARRHAMRLIRGEL